MNRLILNWILHLFCIAVVITTLSCNLGDAYKKQTPPKIYTITYHSNNGLSQTNTQTVLENRSFLLNGNSFIKDSFGFTGWSLLKNSGNIDFSDSGQSNPISSNIDLYANWGFGDTIDPNITNVTMNNGDLDITYSSQSAKLKVWVTDDIFINFIEIHLNGGSKGIKKEKIYRSHLNFEGSQTNGVFTVDFPFPKGYENSTWKLAQILVGDRSGKTTTFDTTTESKWNYSFNVFGKSDLTPPEITNVKLLSDSFVDTSTGEKVVTFEVFVEDDMEIKSLKYTFKNQTNSKWIQGEVLASGSNYIGNRTSGKFKVDVVVKESDSPGVWSLTSFVLYDVSGRSSQVRESHCITNGWPYTFTKAGVADTGPATLLDVRLLTSTVDTTSGNGSVVIEIDAEDDKELAYITVALEHSSRKYLGKTLHTTSPEYSGLDSKSGTFRYNINIDQYIQNGEWYINKIFLADKAGNTKYYFQSELNSLGYSTTFIKSGPQDLETPSINSFELLPPSVNHSTIDVSTEAKTISFLVNVSDDTSVVSIKLSLHGPSALDNEYIKIDSRTPGFNGNGENEVSFVIPSDIKQAGIFYIYDIEVTDKAGKSHRYYKTTRDTHSRSLKKHGWDYYFNVIK